MVQHLNQNIFDPVNITEQPICITADPPYGDIVDEQWDKCDATKHYMRCAEIADQLLPVGGSLLIWGGIGKPGKRYLYKSLIDIEEAGKLYLRNQITWTKKRAYGKSNDYLFTREELLWFVKGPPETKPLVYNIPLLAEKRGYAGYNKKYPAKSEYKRRTNVWNDVTEIFRNKKHRCEKPVRLYEIIYETHSNPGDLVIDLYPGSGNAAVAAEKIGRRCILVGT